MSTAVRFLRPDRSTDEITPDLSLRQSVGFHLGLVLGRLEAGHLVGFVVRIADEFRQLEVPDPLVIVIPHPALPITVQDDDDLCECQRPEITILQASGAPLAKQILDRVYVFGLFFARSPFPVSASCSAAAAAFG